MTRRHDARREGAQQRRAETSRTLRAALGRRLAEGERRGERDRNTKEHAK